MSFDASRMTGGICRPPMPRRFRLWYRNAQALRPWAIDTFAACAAIAALVALWVELPA